ncbi:MAG: phage major capsid protein, partial [Balneolales bacterium]
MNKEQYNKARTDLMAAIEGFMGESKLDEANAKMKEVEELDNKWEDIKLANANLDALKDKTKATDLDNKSLTVEGGKQVDSTKQNETLSEAAVYEAAWSKQMMGQKIEGSELEVFNKVNKQFDNAYTHDTGNTGVLIPETVVAGIWSRAEEMYPLF